MSMDNMEVEVPVLKLWADGSAEAASLEQSLRQQGYRIEAIFSGAVKPAAELRGTIISGYSQIRSVLVERRVEARKWG